MSQPWIPKEYQLDAVRLAVSNSCSGTFLLPGLGKTSTMLAVFDLLKSKGAVKKCLVIAPLRVCQLVWRQEAKKWDEFKHLRFQLLHGADKGMRARIDADVYLMNPEGLASTAGNWYEKYHDIVGADMLIVDESTRFKNSQSKRFKNLKGLLTKFKRRYILTGTVQPKGLEDLFGQTYILDRGAALGQYITHFRNKYFDSTPTWGGYANYTPKAGAQEEIVAKLKPFCMFVDDSSLDLPEMVENTIDIELPPDARRLYDAMEDDFYVEMADKEVITVTTAATASMKMRQVCNGGLYSDAGVPLMVHNAKIEALESVMEESGMPVLCAVQFLHDVQRIREYFKEDIPYLGGGMKEKDAVNAVNSFNEGNLRLLLAHPKSAGHGLNLQGSSNQIFFFGLPWSLEEYLQFIRRVYRQGNPNTRVFLHRALCVDTIEQRMLEVINDRDNAQNAIHRALQRR